MSDQDDPRDAQQTFLTLAALADGEPVDPGDLTGALADPAAREYLVDLIALRQAVERMSAVPGPRWHRRPLFSTRAGWLTAAAAVVISVTTGYVAGQRVAARTLAAPAIETFVDLGSPAAAPQPTRVIPLRPGIDWTETAERK
jgi:hypothetical protein